MFKKLLLTADLQEDPSVACDLVVGISQTFGAETALLHIREHALKSARARARADANLARWIDRLNAAGLTPNTTIRDGVPSQEILLEARALGADLIVTVDAGRHSIRNRILGSTISRLTVSSSRPILIASPTGNNAAWPPESILFPVDFSDYCRAAAPLVGELAATIDCTATMIHVDANAKQNTIDDIRHGDLVSACEKMLHNLPEKERFNRMIKASHSNIAATICTEAQAHDLIVIAATGKNVLQRLLIGSVSEQILRIAPCPVMVV
jgi:nucleotide-binding universal stress UspA family protein